MSKWTSGPWQWELNEKCKQLRLCSRGNLTVMDFVRWGMGGAIPRFISPTHLMQKASEHGVIVPGREHHADWHKGIDHPDARLIAAAPELVEALGRMVKVAQGKHVMDSERLYSRSEVLEQALAALRKAGVE